VTITVSREEVVRMLERAANDVGLVLRDFYEFGKTDRLDDPWLRDLWLIWGDTLTEEDLGGSCVEGTTINRSSGHDMRH